MNAFTRCISFKDLPIKSIILTIKNKLGIGTISDKEGNVYRKAMSIDEFKSLIKKDKSASATSLAPSKSKTSSPKTFSAKEGNKRSKRKNEVKKRKRIGPPPIPPKTNRERIGSPSIPPKTNRERVAPPPTPPKTNRERIDPPPTPPKTNIASGKSFTEFEIEPALLQSLKSMGFKNTTLVQEKTLPLILAGKNVMCASETGSGKTIAFLLPMVHRLMKQTLHQALILSPTREIAIQTNKVLKDLLGPLAIKSGLVIGGTDMLEQKRLLREYPPVLVATPGRLLDMITSGLVWLTYTEFVVLDEADRMLDMGFEQDLLDIHKELPGNQQTLLFTATLMPTVEKVAAKYAKNFEKVTIGKPVTTNSNVTHVVIKIDSKNKLPRLIEMIKGNSGKIIVFFNTIRETISVHRTIQKKGVRYIECLHSGKSQEDRERTIAELKSGKKRVLLATDVAARGLDIPYVELVINYDLPFNPEEYIHRIGRTGRAGNVGLAKSFYTPNPKDKRILTNIEAVLKQKITFEN